MSKKKKMIGDPDHTKRLVQILATHIGKAVTDTTKTDEQTMTGLCDLFKATMSGKTVPRIQGLCAIVLAIVDADIYGEGEGGGDEEVEPEHNGEDGEEEDN